MDNMKRLNLVYDNWSDSLNGPHQSNCINVFTDTFHMNRDSYINNRFLDDANRFKIEDVEHYPYLVFYHFIVLMPSDIKKQIERKGIPMTNEALECLRQCKNFNVVYMNSNECEGEESFATLDQWSKSIGLNQTQLWFATNNPMLEIYKQKYNSEIHVYSTQKMISFSVSAMSRSVVDPTYVPNKMGKFFMSHNKRVKPHRHGLLVLLKKRDLLNNVDWSMIDNIKWNGDDYRHWYNTIFSTQDMDSLIPEIKYFENIPQKKSHFERHYDWDNDEHDYMWGKINAKKQFENSYVNITTETNYLTRDIHISEKSFKPFYGLQFPLILATYHHIDSMRKQYTFDFFDDIINHDYDNEPDNQKRILLFVKEIERIYRNKDFFIKFYQENKGRIMHNYYRLLEWKEDNTDFDFFTKLVNNTYGIQ